MSAAGRAARFVLGARMPGTIRRLLLPPLLAVAALVPTTVPADSIRIENELFIGVWSPFGRRWQAQAAVCVRSENRSPFRVIATPGDGGGEFALDAGGGATIPYRVLWRVRGGDGAERLSPAVPSRQVIRGVDDTDCRGSVRVRVARRDIEAAPPGIYGGTLVLTLAPL